MDTENSEIKLFRGEVAAIKHYKVDTGFLVFSLRLENGGKLTRSLYSCAGTSDDVPSIGTFVEVYGTFSMHPSWGPQVKYTAFHTVSGSSNHAVASYVKSFAKFLGDVKSMALAKHFGTNLEHVLDNEPDRLLEVDGIGETIRDNIVEGWRRDRSVHSIKIFLASIGLADHKIRLIVGRHGPQYDQVLKEDPYVLAAEGIGFSICDQIAEKLKISPQAPCRVKGLVLEAIRTGTVRGEGHLFTTQERILSYANEFNSSCAPSRKLDETGISWDLLSTGVEHLKTHGFVVEPEPGCYYLMAHFFYEAKAAELLAQLLASPGEAKLGAKDPEELVSYYQAHERIALPEFCFSPEQAEAIRSFVKEKVLVVTGPPGTGKTTIIKTFVRILDSNKVSFCLLAPTGAASKRLEQTSSKPAATIHRHLGYKGDSWGFHSARRLAESVVIVDEFSMVDMELMYRLVSALRDNAHLVLVGDVEQLPSVGPGNVLKGLIQSGQIKTIFLETVHRQAALSEIVLQANKIKHGETDMSLFRQDINADVCFVNTARDISAAETAIISICKSLEASTNKSLTYQVVTPRNEGDLSVASLNTLLQGALNPAGGSLGGGSVAQIQLERNVVVRPGDKVVIIKNNYNLGVFNGDVGKVRYITQDKVRVDLVSGESVAIPISDARALLKLGYALTVHKVQGNEYSVVILPLIKTHGHMLLQRNLLYTALTRAKKKVVVVGQEAAIEAAITNASIKNRNTKFSQRLVACSDEFSGGLNKFTQDLYKFTSDCQNYSLIQSLLHPEVASRNQAIDDSL